MNEDFCNVCSVNKWWKLFAGLELNVFKGYNYLIKAKIAGVIAKTWILLNNLSPGVKT